MTMRSETMQKHCSRTITVRGIMRLLSRALEAGEEAMKMLGLVDKTSEYEFYSSERQRIRNSRLALCCLPSSSGNQYQHLR